MLILATGVASESEAEQLVLGVIKRGDQEQNQRARLYLLAIACAEAAVRFPKGSAALQTVTERLKKIVPPKKIGDAKELASAGELVVPFLEYNPAWTAPRHVACVRCLAFIGGESASAVIAKYRRSEKSSVWREILKASDHIDNPDNLRDAFAADRTTCGLTRLSLPGAKVSDVSALASLTGIQTLDLGETRVSDVSALASLTSLQVLWLNNTPVSDVSALANLTSLQMLYLQGTQVSDVSALNSLVKRGLTIYR